jgi:hypothetical protein
MLRRTDTHELRVYTLNESTRDYQPDRTLSVQAYPPGTESATGTRQTMGGLAEDADMVAGAADPAADAIEQGQSVVLERCDGSGEHAYLVESVTPLTGRYGGVEYWVVALAREEGADLSLFPDS